MVLLHAVSNGLGDRTLLAHVEHDAALYTRATTLIGEPIQYPLLLGVPEFLRGQLCAAAGQTEEARALFEAAAVASRSSPHAIFPHFFAWHFGELVGGARGAALCAEADPNLRAAGVRRNTLELRAPRF